MSTVAGSNHWPNAVERADDGDAAEGATFISTDELAHRTEFLRQNAALAIANQRLALSTSAANRYTAVCWAPGAGPFDPGMFVAAGEKDGGGAALAFSYTGANLGWYTQAFGTILLSTTTFTGVAHGGAGALGSRTIAFCGWIDDGANDRPCILTIPDECGENANPLIPETAEGEFTYAYVGAALNAKLRSICWNGTVFCAVGDGGLIVTLSADLLTDTVRTPGSSYTGGFGHVFADSAGRLFAVGTGGEIQRSIDNGVTWVRVFSDAARTLTKGVAITINGVESLVVGADNRVVRSINQGAASSWAAVATVDAAIFPGNGLVFKLGKVLCQVLRHTSSVWRAMCLYSFDGGATWPLHNFTELGYGSTLDAAADNPQRAVIVGGTFDGTTAAHIFATNQIVEPTPTP